MEISKKSIVPEYEIQHYWEQYADGLATEYIQCLDEGLDVSEYEELFSCVRKMPKGDARARIADVIYDIVLNAKRAQDYKYVEPSDLDGIKAERKIKNVGGVAPSTDVLRQKIAGAWYGRICGCLLGKTVEGIKTEELLPLLKESGNYPMHRYIRRTDVTENMLKTFKYDLSGRVYADMTECAPTDDDTNYTVLYQKIIDKYGKDFTPYDVSRAWLAYQPINAYCTAERVAYCNFVKGFVPPYSAAYKNPFREWIGAQIRGDYFGYINPGSPDLAAEMAWRDASVSHVKNGIYGEMFVAAMISCAAVCGDMVEVIEGGLSPIPEKSRLHEAIERIIQLYKSNYTDVEVFDDIHSRWDEHIGHAWCHTISNAEIVAAALLYGGGDYGRSVCLAVQTGFDTDCNGATVGSVLGMMNGVSSIGSEWLAPINGRLDTSIFGVGKINIDDAIDKTMEHIEKIKL